MSAPAKTRAAAATASSPDRGRQRGAAWPSRFGLATAFGGAVILAGWAFDLPVVRSGIPGHAATRPNAAVAFILAGMSLWLLTPSSSRLRLIVARICAAAVTLLGLLTCLEFVLGWDLGIDRLFATQTSTAQLPFAGRMQVVTAISFAVTGSALLLTSTKRQRLHAAAQALVLPVMYVALAGLAGHLFDARDMEALTPSAVASALPTTILFLLVLRGMLERYPDQGLMATVSSRRPGGTMARRLLPAFMWISLGLGLLFLVGQRMGLYDTALLVALFVVASTVLAAVVIWRTSIAQPG